MSKFKQQLIERVRSEIQDHLKNHTVEQLHKNGDICRVWRCSNSGSSVHSFTVCSTPGWLIVYGDMGECMWSRTCDMINFARGAIHSLAYFSEKASRDCIIDQEYPELAKEWIDSAEDEFVERTGESMSVDQRLDLQAIRDVFNEQESIHDLQIAIYESECFGHDSEQIPSCKFYTYHYLWKIEALKWFFAKIDSEIKQSENVISPVQCVVDKMLSLATDEERFRVMQNFCFGCGCVTDGARCTTCNDE